MTPHQNIRRLNDWVVETPESIAARLEGAKASQSQIRLTIGVMAVISMMMLIASYNAYLSYDYGWTLDVVDRQLPTEKTVASVLTEQALKDWASSRIVQISLLGIRVSVDDAAVLGTLVLLVLSLWLLLLARRENHTIGFLLRDTDTPHPTGIEKRQLRGPRKIAPICISVENAGSSFTQSFQIASLSPVTPLYRLFNSSMVEIPRRPLPSAGSKAG